MTRAVEPWQPMETAPHDGSPVILWMVHENAKYAKDPVAEGWEAEVAAHWIDHNGGGWTWYGLAGRPTRWRRPAHPMEVTDG